MREEVLDAALAPQLVEFETNMGLLFGGKPFGELLARLDGDAHFVLTRQTFAPRAPTVRYPAGALILPIKEEKSFWPQMLVAFQTALGFVNADRGQKGEPPLLIEVGTHREVTIATTRYLEEKETAPDAALPSYRNVQPACAVVRGELVLSSSDALLRDIIDAELDDRHEAHTDALESLSLNGRAIGKILAENQAALVTQNMLEKGHGKVKAEREMTALLGLIGLFDDAILTTRALDGGLRVSLRLRLRRSELVQSDGK
jgi:hypothetical protein